MRYISYNYEWKAEDDFCVSKDNRAFRYGDGFFETIAARNGKILFWEKHKERIESAIQLLRFEMDWDAEKFKNHLIELLAINGVQHARLRVQWWRNGRGFYSPIDNTSSFYAELYAVDNVDFKLIEISETKIYFGNSKGSSSLYSFKNLGSSLYVLASLFASENNISECILLNNEGRVCEGSRSNIFVVENGVCFTPPLSEGCISGVVRSVLLEKNDRFTEREIDITMLKEADEVFFCNTSGILSVKRYMDKLLDKKIAEHCSAILRNYM